MASHAFGHARRALVIGTLAAAGVAAPSAMAAQLTQAEVSGRVLLLREMNAARTSHGLKPLRMSRVLNRPAVRHSQFLARTGRLQHEGSDGKPFYVRLYKAGFSRRKAVGENLGMIGGCSLDASKIMVSMWLQSPAHRRNLLDPNYHVVGLPW